MNMWRMKVTVVTIVMLGTLMFGAVVAYAGWGWNAKVDIDGTKISTSWAVDDVSGARDYHAEITVGVPSGTDASIIKTAPTENVMLVDGGSCSNGVINAVVTYMITSDGGDGTDVSVSVDRVGGGGKHNYGSGEGTVGSLISVMVEIDGDCNS